MLPASLEQQVSLILPVEVWKEKDLGEMVWAAELAFLEARTFTFSLLKEKWLKLALEEGQRDLCSRDSSSNLVGKI